MSDQADTPAGRDAAWLSQGERGALSLMKLVAFLARLFGRRALRPLVRAIALYYVLFDRPAVAASRDWLTRVNGQPPRWRDVFEHVTTFAQVTLDRLFVAMGKLDDFEFSRNGNEHLEALAREKRGAILLGAHLGSFEAMRAAGRGERFPITIVGHFENAEAITSLLRDLDPDFDGTVLHAGQDAVGLALKLKESIARGDFVALLGDRIGLNEKTIRVPFFDEEVELAAGPFLLASILKAPIYLVFGLYEEPNRYSLYCEPFVEEALLPRGSREEALTALGSRYAQRLEAYARQAPMNWFNFFDFWETPSE